mmetsp:Transcript_9161/g.30163  ORF Transcript_9161/g.30163 Transcript_9161/m.30163 type:complete len:289 (+) Transcript_9161:34-900(+)
MKLAFSFDGGGWMFPFNYGVGAYIQDHFDTHSPNLTFAGISCGSCVAAALATDIPMRPYHQDAVNVYDYAAYNPFRMSTALERVLRKHSPEGDDGDAAWTRASGRLMVGVSRGVWAWGPFQQHTVDRFNDREHGVRSVRASAQLPYLAGFLGYKVNGERFWDGGLTSNFVPTDDFDGTVVQVSPWANSTDNWIASDIGFPHMWSYFPRNKSVLKRIYTLGYLKAAAFFQSTELGREFLRKKPLVQDPEEFKEDVADIREFLLRIGAFDAAEWYNPMGPRQKAGNVQHQ